MAGMQPWEVALEMAKDTARDRDRIEGLQNKVDNLEDAMQRIISWSEAYPLDIFPEPDFKKANELLKAGGMTIDAISASCMRHVITSVAKIAKEAMK